MAKEMIAVLGQDARMDFVASYLYHMGYEVCQNVSEATLCDFLILSPVLKKEDEAFLDKWKTSGKILYCGKISEEVKSNLLSEGVQVYSYLEWENLIEENAVLTAKGIIREAKIQNAVLKESHCLVTGYGYCGKEIAQQLAMEGASVDVVVRRKELKREILDNGYDFVYLPHIREYDFEKYSYVFNTIPSLVLDSSILNQLSNNILIFDIASAPGGTDFLFCEKHKIQAGLYLGIPGKVYPKEAGEIMAKYVSLHLEEHISKTCEAIK